MVMVVQILEDEREGNDYLAQRFMYLVNIDIGNICCQLPTNECIEKAYHRR